MTRTAGAIGALSLLLAISAVSNVRLMSKTAELEQRLESAPAGQAKPPITTRSSSGSTADLAPGANNPDAKPPLDDDVDILAEIASDDPSLILSLPEVEEAMEAQLQQRIANKRKAWQEQRLAQAQAGLEQYAETADLSEETQDEIEELMIEAMVDISILREERHAGTLPDQDAFQSLGDVRTTFAEDLIEVLGEEEARSFQEHLTGPLSKNYY